MHSKGNRCGSGRGLKGGKAHRRHTPMLIMENTHWGRQVVEAPRAGRRGGRGRECASRQVLLAVAKADDNDNDNTEDLSHGCCLLLTIRNSLSTLAVPSLHLSP